VQAARTTTKFRRVKVEGDFSLRYGNSLKYFSASSIQSSNSASQKLLLPALQSTPIEPFIHDPMEEIAFGPSAWLWDYLRRSKQRGYFLALSGGADSGSTATLVGIMCQRVYKEIAKGSTTEQGMATSTTPLRAFEQADDLVFDVQKTQEEKSQRMLQEVRLIVRDPAFLPKSGKDICERLFFTCYMASQYSGAETRRRAVEVSRLIGARHCSIFIDDITEGIQKTFADVKFHDTNPSYPRLTPGEVGGR
jgi:NAD+ synthase (glutamine-hydrolysing)